MVPWPLLAPLCVVVLALLGYGLARLLVPDALWGERWALAPLAGVALVVLVQDLAGFFWPAGDTAWVVVAVSAAITALALKTRGPPASPGRSSWAWLLAFVVVAAAALLPNLVTGAALANLTNHDAFAYAVLEGRLAEHAYDELPRLGGDLLPRYYLFLARDFWRVGGSNLGVTLDTLLGVEALQGFGARLALLAGLVPVSLGLALRVLSPALSRARCWTAATAVTLLSATPVLLAAEAYLGQLSAVLWYPLQLALGARALVAGDRRSLCLGVLFTAAGLALYPELQLLVALPLLGVVIAALTIAPGRGDRWRLAGRALLLALLAAAAAPFSVLRLVASLGRLQTIHVGSWPAATPTKLLAALLGAEPDPGQPRAIAPWQSLLLVGAIVATGWLAWHAWRALQREARALLVVLLCACPAVVLLVQLVAGGDGYVPLKAALTAGALLLLVWALGLARAPSWPPAPRWLVGVALLVGTLLPLGVGPLWSRLVAPRIVLDGELRAFAAACARLPSRSVVLLEPLEIDFNRRILLEHVAALGCAGGARQLVPLPDTSSYLGQIGAGTLAGRRPPRRPLFLVQARGGGFSPNAGKTLWRGATLQLLRAAPGAVGRARPAGFYPADRPAAGGGAEPVIWSAGRSALDLELAPAAGPCVELRLRVRAAAGERELLVRAPPAATARTVAIGPAWRDLPILLSSGRRTRVELRSPGAPRRLAGDRRQLAFAVSDPRLVDSPCGRARWGAGWYGAERDEHGPFRWSGRQGALQLLLAAERPCHQLELEAVAVPGPDGRLDVRAEAPRARWTLALGPRWQRHRLPICRAAGAAQTVQLRWLGEPRKVGRDTRSLAFRIRPPVVRACTVPCARPRAEPR